MTNIFAGLFLAVHLFLFYWTTLQMIHTKIQFKFKTWRLKYVKYNFIKPKKKEEISTAYTVEFTLQCQNDKTNIKKYYQR